MSRRKNDEVDDFPLDHLFIAKAYVYIPCTCGIQSVSPDGVRPKSTVDHINVTLVAFITIPREPASVNTV